MTEQTVITEKDLITTAKAAEQLGVCKAQVCKYVRENKLRRIRDSLNKNYSYIYKPDVEKFISDRYYFEEKNNDK